MQKVKILLVEDNIYVADELCEKLNSWGYHIIGVAQNAKEALNYFKNHEVDIAVIDIELQASTMQGPEIAAIMRKDRSIPILFLTGVQDHTLLSQTCIEDPVRFLQKADKDISLQMNLAALSAQLAANRNTLFIRHKGELERVAYQDIIYMVSGRGCTLLYLKNRKTRTYPGELGKFLVSIPPYFVRIHRSHAININYLKSIRKGDNWQVSLGISSDEGPLKELNVSSSYKIQLQAILENHTP